LRKEERKCEERISFLRKESWIILYNFMDLNIGYTLILENCGWKNLYTAAS
jgi:hypothetical protein